MHLKAFGQKKATQGESLNNCQTIAGIIEPAHSEELMRSSRLCIKAIDLSLDLSSTAWSLHKHPPGKAGISHSANFRHVKSCEVRLFGSAPDGLVVFIFQSVLPSMIRPIVSRRNHCDPMFNNALFVFLP